MAVFLDRDGVVNAFTEGKFVRDWKEFAFLPGSLEALALLKSEEIPVIVISNQSGIGRGVVTLEQVLKVMKRMMREIKKRGGKIRAVYLCPHNPDARCSCRKPQPGLLLQAAEDLKIDLSSSYFIGDSLRDLEAGKKAGCKTVFVLSGQHSMKDLEKSRGEIRPDCIARDLLEAVWWISKEIRQ